MEFLKKLARFFGLDKPGKVETFEVNGITIPVECSKHNVMAEGTYVRGVFRYVCPVCERKEKR